MAQNPNRLMDKTHLSLDMAEERLIIHRDFIAHCFRWSHVVKQLMAGHAFKDAHIIDVGCGRDQPLPRLLYSNRMTGFDYSGIDINSLLPHEALVTAHTNGKMRVALHSETDASVLPLSKLKWGFGTHLVCFECLEHIQPFIAYRMLQNWKELLADGAQLFVSTPVFNGSAAANHINEMGWQSLGSAFEHHGYTVENFYGTFASKSDLMQVMTDDDRRRYEQLSKYYDSNVLSTIFAPLYPTASRNILWSLRLWKNVETPRRFPIMLTEDSTELNQNSDIEEIFTGRPA